MSRVQKNAFSFSDGSDDETPSPPPLTESMMSLESPPPIPSESMLGIYPPPPPPEEEEESPPPIPTESMLGLPPPPPPEEEESPPPIPTESMLELPPPPPEEETPSIEEESPPPIPTESMLQNVYGLPPIPPETKKVSRKLVSQEITPSPASSEIVEKRPITNQDKQLYIDEAREIFGYYDGLLATIVPGGVAVVRDYTAADLYNVIPISEFKQNKYYDSFGFVTEVDNVASEFINVNSLKEGDKVFTVTDDGLIVKVEKFTSVDPVKYAVALDGKKVSLAVLKNFIYTFSLGRHSLTGIMKLPQEYRSVLENSIKPVAEVTPSPQQEIKAPLKTLVVFKPSIEGVSQEEEQEYFDLARKEFRLFEGKLWAAFKRKNPKSYKPNDYNVIVTRESVNGPYALHEYDKFFYLLGMNQYAHVKEIFGEDLKRILQLSTLQPGDKIFSLTKVGDIVKTEKISYADPKWYASLAINRVDHKQVLDFIAGYKPSSVHEPLMDFYSQTQKNFTEGLFKPKEDVKEIKEIQKVSKELKELTDSVRSRKDFLGSLDLSNSVVVDGKVLAIGPDIEDKKNIQDAKVAAHAVVEGKLEFSISDFERIKELGKGAFGTVYSVKSAKTGATLVLKQMDKLKTSKEDIDREIVALEHLKPHCGEYILCYDTFFQDEKSYYILTEFLGNYDTLSSVIGLLAKDASMENIGRLRQIIINLIRGLREIHKQGFAHRDIKPANIMVETKGSKIKYIDFGLAVDKKSSIFASPGGTISFMAPELWSYDPKTLLDFQLGDIFALGTTIYQLITGFSRIEIWTTEKQNLSYVKYFSDYDYPDKNGKAVQTLDETFIKFVGLVLSNLSDDARFQIVSMIFKIPSARKLPLV